jgi:LmbE family N-acetylglucosaminyl deacetylase
MNAAPPPPFVDLSEPPDRVLVCVAHPDDIDFGVAGTVARLTDAGSEVVYGLATSGEAGPPEDMDRDELVAIREREQRAAAAVVGVTDVRFLGLPDGHLVADLATRKVVSRLIRDIRPDLVITQSPERRWESVYASHPDHLAFAEATVSAVYPDSRNPYAHPELLAERMDPHTVPELWVTGLHPADLFVDLSPVIATKAKALCCHQSQVGWIDDVEKLLADWARDNAKRHGFADGVMIESFRRIPTGSPG